jgi:large subunit ribosomal protein L4
MVSGTGKKPWRQKGTGRAQVGEARNPLWRHGGTTFGPQPRSYEYQLPKKVEKGALRAALTQKLRDGQVIVVDALSVAEIKTRAAAEMLQRIGIDGGKTLLVDVKPEDKLSLSVRNIDGVRILASNRVSARDVMNTRRVVLTREAMEKLQEALG